jgi:hypothetical protein
MMPPDLQRLSDGSVRLVDLAPWFVGVILELPELLDSDQPEAVSQRLYPEPSDDEEHKKDWEKFVRPELFALVATARDIVLKDIGNMGPCSIESEEALDLSVWQIDIPETHIHAWISALNVARLTLSSRYTIEDDDMAEPEELSEPEEDLESGEHSEPGELPESEEPLEPGDHLAPEALPEPEAHDDTELEFDEKHFAVARIHLLGWLQQLLIEAEAPPPPDFDPLQGLE